MSLTFDQLLNWRPHDLVEVAQEWITLADDLDERFERYANALVRTGDGGYWEGAAADAAQQRAQDDRRHLAEMTDEVRGLAALLNDNWYSIEAPLLRGRSALTALQGYGLSPQGDSSVGGFCARIPSMMIGGKLFKEHPEATQQEIRQFANELTDGVNSAKSADDALREQLATRSAGLPAMFTSAAALGSGQGVSDANDLVNGTFSPADVERLIDAGTLSPDQLAALQAGQAITVPASTMQYMNELARALDGKSPQEIQEIMDKLPPEGKQALSNSLNLVSNERVNGGPAGNGSFDKLPATIRESLTRDDLVVGGYQTTSGGGFRTIELNGVADNQAIAAVVAAGDDRYMQGSSLDRHLLDVGRQYLDAQVAWEQDPNKKFISLSADGMPIGNSPVTEPIFQAVGSDKIALEEFLGDTTNPSQGKDFVTDILTHNWTDDGKAAAALFTFGSDDAVVNNPHDPVDVATANRTGNIMSMVGEWVSTEEQWKKLADVGDNQSAGERNPEVVRALSTSLSPYVGALAGDHRPELPGFNTVSEVTGKSWIDPQDNNTYPGSRPIFALMNTDEDASKQFTGAAMERMLQYEAEYAKNPYITGAESNLAWAGVLNGLYDRGLQEGLQASQTNEYEAAKEAYDRKSSVYDAVKAGTQFGASAAVTGLSANPLAAEFVNRAIDGTANPVKDSIIGPAPTPGSAVQLDPPNFTQRNYEVISRMDVPADKKNEYSILFDNGELRSWDDLRGTGNSSRPDLTRWVDALMGEMPGSQEFRNAYEDVTRTAPRER